MASFLELPIDVLPNDHSPAWFRVWCVFLEQFGISISYLAGAKSPIWLTEPWIAQVKSINFEGGSHVILAHLGGRVLFDPSTKKRYKKGSMLKTDDVIGGYQFRVIDVAALYHLGEYRRRITGYYDSYPLARVDKV